MSSVKDFANILDQAALQAAAVEQLSNRTNLSLQDAYAIQSQSVQCRLERGERMVGAKVGFTSRAKRIQMGVNDLIWGRLTSEMMLEDGGELPLSRFIHPRIEPELAFLLGKPLAGKVSIPEALAAVEAVAPAMEIIDSRYREFKFSLADVIADNASSSAFVIGAWTKPIADTANLGVVMSVNGMPVQIGSSAAIMGHPARALVAAARLVAESDLQLEAGWIIMAGAATAAEAIAPNMHIRTSIEQLGNVAITARA